MSRKSITKGESICSRVSCEGGLLNRVLAYSNSSFKRMRISITGMIARSPAAKAGARAGKRRRVGQSVSWGISCHPGVASIGQCPCMSFRRAMEIPVGSLQAAVAQVSAQCQHMECDFIAHVRAALQHAHRHRVAKVVQNVDEALEARHLSRFSAQQMFETSCRPVS
jgi:hypothetical protein